MRNGALPDATVMSHRPPGRALTKALIGLSLVPSAALIVPGLLPATGARPDLCILHRVTGMWCPLCGGTRATGALLRGDLTEALGYNAFALVTDVILALVLLRWLLAWRRGGSRALVSQRELIAYCVLASTFAVVRNLPGMWVYLGPLLGPAG